MVEIDREMRRQDARFFGRAFADPDVAIVDRHVALDAYWRILEAPVRISSGDERARSWNLSSRLSLAFLALVGVFGIALAEGDAVERNFEDPKAVALVRAAGRGDAEAVKKLISDGANPNVVGKEGLTPIAWAIGQHNEAGVEALLDNGVPLDVSVPGLFTVASAAAQGADPWLLKLFLRKGLSPDFRNRDGETLLFVAILGLQRGNVEILLDAGADVNATSRGRDRAIVLAARLNQFDIAERLIERGADPRSVGANGATVARYLAQAELNPASNLYAAQQRLKALFKARGIAHF